ncbi:uncharacterized protein K452DRAFT_287488 [Aplosporella prunicola CBS 121167]|uniref:F-box domain-containing protein n=1 Tax=Aplosporella prunicola CBS 121167 TaxID=1176127 RepID=A0A6A6BHB8_9PEZI|nr:uncharacterized protein K452DRAFT_287488 [Aplosporella prunicola CBS 121167]KAF2142267.1 hypothetical protein K452DRAFT_287488 [Aplosporella prunicola CBS 121167]
MTAALFSLPIKLVEMICAYLRKANIGSLRLAYRELSTKTRPAFYLACFETVDLVLCKKYIERLAEIARHPQARKAVRKFKIRGNPKGFGKRGFARNFEGQGDWRRTPSGYLEPPFPVDIDLLLGPILSDGFSNCHTFQLEYLPSDHDRSNKKMASEGDALAILLRFIASSSRPISSFHITTCGSLSRVPVPLLQDLSFTRRWQENLRELIFSPPLVTPDKVLNSPASLLITKATNLTKLTLKLFYPGFLRQIFVSAPS